jgi:hypothetical protein
MVGIDIPDFVDGRSLLPILQGSGGMDRQAVHMEVAGQFQALTDGREKYIWHTGSGREQLFNLNEDRAELRDLAPDQPERVLIWRRRLIDALRDRPEGFTDGARLFAGLPKVKVLQCSQTPAVNESEVME